MPATKHARRYNRFQRALLLIQHYAKTRLGVPLAGFTLLVLFVVSGCLVVGVFSYFVSVVLTHLYPGKFILERDFMNVWVPCAIVVGVIAQARLLGKPAELWEEKLRVAMTSPPPAEINAMLPDAQVLVRASNPAASDSLLTPASAPPDAEPETLLRAANRPAAKFHNGSEK